MSEINSAELTEWHAYDAIEPFGDARNNLHAAMIASAVVNHSMSPPKTAAKPLDFMPFTGKRQSEAPILLKDKKAQAKLMKEMLFGVKT